MLLSRPSRGTQETIQEIKKKNWWRICKMLRRNLKLRRCKTCKSTSIILSQPPGYITFDCFVCKFVCCLLWQMHIIFLMPLNIKYVSQLDICFFVSIFERPDEGRVWNVAIKYKFCKSDRMLECVCETLVWGFLFLCFKTVLHACGHVQSWFVVFLLCLGGYDCNGDLKPA